MGKNKNKHSGSPAGADTNLIENIDGLSRENNEYESPPFDVKKASHEISTKRLEIAQFALLGVGGLLLLCLFVLWCWPLADRREILSAFISSLFGIATLILGFVAGSSIDNNR